MDLLALSFKLMILVPILTTKALSPQECVKFVNHDHTCGKNLTCVVLKNADGFGYCACHSPFYQTANETCLLKQYGKSCNLNEDCGSGTNLICDEQKLCSCNSNYSIYDQNTHECVGNLGASCDEHGKPCGFNETCSNELLCKCSTNFFENSSGECEAKRGHGSSCKDNSDSCKTPFICDSNFRCSCNSSTFLYDNAKEKCSRLVDVACTYYPWNHRIIIEDCVENAKCTSTEGDYIKCQCRSGYRKTLMKTCAVVHGSSCTNDDTRLCDEEQEGTLCIEGRCSCRAGHVFDRNRRQCVARLHRQCNETLSCAEDTHCELVPKENFKQCVCNQGLVEVDNNCHPTLGQPCDFNDVYFRKPSRICDPLAGSLQCVNGICQCKSMEYYDRGSQKCRGLFGSYCDLENLDDNGNDKYCTQNAQCVVRRVLLSKQGMCTCKLDWKRTADGFCN